MVRIMYTRADELVGSGKDLEFKERVGDSKPQIVVIIETESSKDVTSRVDILEGYTITRREREG